jgi:NAD(P)H-dependent flavin oxidoreductase YrpB (nitropropane dioxygenase family)
MKTAICDTLGIDFPLVGFSHSRDVVAAVSNAGGFGVLGASLRSPDELEHELAWIDDSVDGKPYGVNIVVPEKFEGKGMNLTWQQIAAMVPQEHHDYVARLLSEHGVSLDDVGGEPVENPSRLSDSIGEELLDVSFRHPIKLISNALGVPPAFMVERARSAGVPIAALAGNTEHAVKQVRAGVDIVVAQGTEAGGHCGEVTTMVLVPEIIEAIRQVRQVPVLAAGGIVTGRQIAASVALGAAGAWTGSVWLTTEEAETAPFTMQKMLAATSRDTVRSTGRTGKPSRQLRSAWTDAWEAGAGGPKPLPMPLQSVLSENVLRRIDTLAKNGNKGAQELATYWVGQGVGLLNKVRPAREVVREMIEDYLEAVERLTGSLED